MKRLFTAILAYTALSVQVQAQDCCYSNSCTDCFGFDSALTYDIGGGYRQDTLEWSIYPTSLPGTVEKEDWKNLQMGIIETNAQFLVCQHFYTRFDFDYGWFYNGGHQTIQAGPINSRSLTRNLKSETNGHVYNIDAAIGYQFNMCSCRFAFTPLVGYSYHFQKLKNCNYTNDLTLSEFKTKNNYKLRWRGATAGFTTAYQVTSYWQLNFTYAYHWIRFRGKVAERFPTEPIYGNLKSNNGNGNEFTLGTTYEFCPNWILGAKVDYKVFQGNKGKFTPDDERELSSNILESPLRKLKWTSLNATIDLLYIF